MSWWNNNKTQAQKHKAHDIHEHKEKKNWQIKTLPESISKNIMIYECNYQPKMGEHHTIRCRELLLHSIYLFLVHNSAWALPEPYNMDFQQFLRTSHLEIFILPTTHYGKYVRYCKQWKRLKYNFESETWVDSKMFQQMANCQQWMVYAQSKINGVITIYWKSIVDILIIF